MDITYVPRSFINNTEFLKHWFSYKICALREEEFVCSCGAKSRPVLKYANQENLTKKTLYSHLAVRLNSHINTKKHQQSIARIEGFVEYLKRRFKKQVFNELWNDYLDDEYKNVVEE